MINNLIATDLGAGGVRIGSSSSVGVEHNTVQNSYLFNGGNTFYEGMKRGEKENKRGLERSHPPLLVVPRHIHS